MHPIGFEAGLRQLHLGFALEDPPFIDPGGEGGLEEEVEVGGVGTSLSQGR